MGEDGERQVEQRPRQQQQADEGEALHPEIAAPPTGYVAHPRRQPEVQDKPKRQHAPCRAYKVETVVEVRNL